MRTWCELSIEGMVEVGGGVQWKRVGKVRWRCRKGAQLAPMRIIFIDLHFWYKLSKGNGRLDVYDRFDWVDWLAVVRLIDKDLNYLGFKLPRFQMGQF